MPKKRQPKGKPLDADLDKEVINYQPSDDSDDGLDEEGRNMLDRARHGRYVDDESEEEVFGVHTSDRDSEDEDEDDDQFYGGGVPSDMDSDIEGQVKSKEDGLPDSKAWGSKKSRYYHTDYVDKDYGGFSQAQEEESALMEEDEAKAIQQRLLAHMEGVDFSMGLLDKVAEKKKEISAKAAEADEVKISKDLSKLTKEEKIQYLKQESPEFFNLIEDFKSKMDVLKDTVIPVLNLVETGVLPKCSASEFLKVQRDLIMGYSTNIAFYLYLKSQRVKVDSHPVIKRLYAYRHFLEELESVNTETLSNQLETIKNLLKSGDIEEKMQIRTDDTTVKPKNRKERKELQKKQMEKMRKVMQAKKRATTKLEAKARDPLNPVFEEPGSSEDEDAPVTGDEEPEEIPEEAQTSLKRAITYQMAKNKGLTPRRKKEQRNPRVKHRNKFRKAQIRRKGQVQAVRKEDKRYGGEVSGIRAYTSKSIKLK